MDNTKEKSAVGIGVPATDKGKYYKTIITDFIEKIKEEKI